MVDDLCASTLAAALLARADWLDLPRNVEAPRPYISREQFRAAAALLSEHDRQREEIVRLVEALTPSRDTKAAYIGEFSHRVTSISDEGEEQSFEAAVPWPTIKEIMAAILARSALSDTTVVEGRPECICPTCGIRHGGTVTDDIQF